MATQHHIFLTSVQLDPEKELPARYPFSVPQIAQMGTLHLDRPVTFLAGENGSGKSTLLEALAAAAGSIPVHASDSFTDRSLAPASELAECLRLVWRRRTHRGFLLRAEDFFGYKRHLSHMNEELATLADDLGERLTGYGRQLATGAVQEQRRALVERYGENPDARSHGESFLHFFHSRFTGAGLYLLDEPDTALSVQSTFGLLAMLKQMVAEGAQFIIATHSPVLLALPGAAIISFDRVPVEAVAYEDLDQVTLLRQFLDSPGAFLRHL